MRIAITGAGGHIGSAMLRRSAADRGHEIIGVVRRTAEFGPDGAEVEWVRTDVTEDERPGALERDFVTHGPVDERNRL